jgi:hypothetical protein
MGNSSTITTSLDQTDEEILTYPFTISDEALEAAASTEGGGRQSYDSQPMTGSCQFCC